MTTEAIRSEVEEILFRVKNGIEKPKRVKQSPSVVKANGPSQRGVNMINRPPKYSRDQIKKLFTEGLSVTEIAKTTGAHRATVSAALNDAGVPAQARPRGRHPADTCPAGLHDMEEFGRKVKGPKGGRYCLGCKRIREAKK